MFSNTLNYFDIKVQLFKYMYLNNRVEVFMSNGKMHYEW